VGKISFRAVWCGNKFAFILVPMSHKFKEILKSLKPNTIGKLAAFGLFLKPILQWLINLINNASNFDFTISAGSNPRMLAVWNFLVSPTGNFISVLLGVLWLTAFVWQQSKLSDKTNSSDLASEEEAKTAKNSGNPPPNIVCLGDVDTFVKLDRRDVFRSVRYSETNLRAFIVEFHNKPNPPHKIGRIDNVQAEITYYNMEFLDLPEQIYRTDYACWLGEESPHISFEVNQKRYLVLGARQGKAKENGYEEGFLIYENNPDPNKSIKKHLDRYTKICKIVVRLVAGEFGEFTREFEFELNIEGASSFTFEYLTDVKKKERRKTTISLLENEIIKGERLLERYRNLTGDSIKNQKFYSEIYDWRWKTEGLIRKRLGVNPSSRFSSNSNKKEYPETFTTKDVDGLNEFYTRLSKLKEMVGELKQNESASM
jgi:hypothetical protein